MKNFLWFSYEPADEREAQVFNKAYKRSLNFLWQFLLLIWIIAPFQLSSGWGNIEITQTRFIVPFLIIGSWLAGWTAIRKEELIYKKPFTGATYGFWLEYITMAIFLVVLVYYFLEFINQ